MPRFKPLSPKAKEILASIALIGRWYVTAETLVPVAELITAGLITARDEYEGPELRVTDTGRARAIVLGLVHINEDGEIRPGSATEAAQPG